MLEDQGFKHDAGSIEKKFVTLRSTLTLPADGNIKKL
jgi:hypothetical protein